MTEWRKRMQIHPKDAGGMLPDPTQSSHAAPVADGDAVGVISATPASVERTDPTPIADAGRALEPRDSWPGSAALDARRASQIRRRVLSGAYHSLEVVDAVARRLLDSGDL
jgi:negative regulator of flagellin synthesis FlgM